MARTRNLSRAISGGVAAVALTFIGVNVSTSAATAAPQAPWDAIARCESGGNWSIDTGNGYYGGLQFSAATWAAYGGRGSAAHSSRAEQIAVGERVVRAQGWEAWSSCSSRLGLHGHVAVASSRLEHHRHHDRSHRAGDAHRAGEAHRAKRDASGEKPAEAHAKRLEHRTTGPRHVAHRVGRHAAAPSTGGATYTVRSGDTLIAIADRLHLVGGWRALADANLHHLAHPSAIRPGLVLHLPASRTTD